ncbi:MAG: flotillin family protein [Deltaproteobacteria bacterium]|nr:flotillin family protein [Deltaproteobacteria bacterium]
MGYRDDRESLRQRNQALEQELAEARRALAKHRGGRNLELADSPQRPPTGLIVCALLALLGVAAVLFRFGLMVFLPAVVGLFVLLLLVLAIGRVRVARPGEVLVLSGRKVRHADGSVSGFRIVTAGRTVPVPVVEHVARLDVRPFLVETRLTEVPTQRSARVTIETVALARIGVAPKLVVRATERFLGQPQEQVRRLVGQSLAGTLRNCLAHLTPTEIATDRDRLVQAVQEEAELDRLGIELMSLRVLAVQDDAGEIKRRGRSAAAVAGGASS